MPWTAADLPDQSGRTVVVTGGNSGIGLEAARALARRGAHVVLACRNLGKAEAARAELRAEVPNARVECRELDLADLSSVRKFAEGFLLAHADLHALVNNAGVMAIPYRQTADGFEMQIGTNHLGHFALAGLLLDRLLETPGGRVVTVSSGMHQIGRIRFDDLHSERRYAKWPAYAQSKLANLLFAFELQRRLDAHHVRGLRSVACHPGYAATNLQTAGPRMSGSPMGERVMRLANRLFAQSAAMGALPTLYAAAAPEAAGGAYIGPDGFTGQSGHPKPVGCSARAKRADDARRLWELSEEQTGVRYDALA